MRKLLGRIVFWGSVLIMGLSPTQWAIRLDTVNDRLPKAFLSATDVLIPLVFGAYVLLCILKRRKGPLPLLPSPWWAFFFVAGLSVLRAVDKVLAVGELFQYGLYLLCLPLLVAHCLQQSSWRRFLALLLPAMVVGIAAWGCMEYLILTRNPWEVKASFGNRNVLSGFLCLGFPLVLGAGLAEGHWKRLWLVLSPIVLLPVLSAGALISALAGGAFVAGRGWGKRGVFFLLLGGALFLCAGRWLLPERGWQTWRESLSPRVTGAPSQRYVEWQAAFNSLEVTPYWGVGVGNYQKNIGRFYSMRAEEKRKMEEEDIYNLYLVQLSSTGLLGFGALVLFFAWVGRELWELKNLPSEESFPWGHAFFGIWVAFCLCNGFSALFVRGVFPLFGFLCGAALWGAGQRKGEEPS